MFDDLNTALVNGVIQSHCRVRAGFFIINLLILFTHQKAGDFSDFQLSLLKNRSSVTRKLNSVRKSLNAAQSASYGIPEGKECDIEARRMESYEGRHYVLIKGKDIGSSYDDRQDDDFLVMDFRNNKQQNVIGIQDDVSDDDTTTELQGIRGIVCLWATVYPHVHVRSCLYILVI